MRRSNMVLIKSNMHGHDQTWSDFRASWSTFGNVLNWPVFGHNWPGPIGTVNMLHVNMHPSRPTAAYALCKHSRISMVGTDCQNEAGDTVLTVETQVCRCDCICTDTYIDSLYRHLYRPIYIYVGAGDRVDHEECNYVTHTLRWTCAYADNKA